MRFPCFLFNLNNEFVRYCASLPKKMGMLIPSHVYLVSNDDLIKGEYCAVKGKYGYMLTTYDDGMDALKILSTTNEELNLPILENIMDYFDI